MIRPLGFSRQLNVNKSKQNLIISFKLYQSIVTRIRQQKTVKLDKQV